MPPYQEALKWIHAHPGTGGSAGLAKLILSVWNDECCFSFRECIRSLDGERTELAVRLVTYFAEHGEDDELVKVGHEVCELYPGLWQLTEVANQAMAQLRQEWEDKRRRERSED